MPKNRWEFPRNRSTKIPSNILNTGDSEIIGSYLDQNREKLLPLDVEYLEQVLRTNDTVSNYRAQAMDRLENGSPVGMTPVVYKVGENGVILNNIHQRAFQSSNNGCWSCFLSNAFQAKGINLSQEEIRTYKPKLTLEEAGAVSRDTSRDMNTDRLNNAYESGDLVSEVLPNSMLKEIEIHPFSQTLDKGIDQAQYQANAADFLKRKIRETIRDTRAPLGILSGGHYRTIVGIDGDTVYFKDSYEYESDKNDLDPDTTYEATISDLIGGALNEGGFGIKLNYIEDVQLSQDGSTLLNVPSEHVSMEPNGDLKLPPENIQEAASNEMNERNRIGVSIKRVGGREGDIFDHTQLFDGFTTYGISMTERTYLPKKLHAKSLTVQAERRSEAEERELRQKHENELKQVAEPRHYTEQELLEIAQKRFNFEEDQKDLAAYQAKKAQQELKKAQAKASKHPEPLKKQVQAQQTQPQSKPEAKPTVTTGSKQSSASEPQTTKGAVSQATTKAAPTQTSTPKASAPQTTAPKVTPTQTQPQVTSPQTAAPKASTTQTIATQTTPPRTAPKALPNSYAMQEDIRNIGQRYRQEFNRLKGLKTDLSDIKSITGALERLSNITGKESPRQLMDMTHDLNVAMVRYEGNNPVKVQIINNLSDLNLSCTKDLMRSKQTEAAKNRELAAEYGKFSSRYSAALDSIKDSKETGMQDIRSALEPLTKLSGKEDLRTISDLTFKLNQALISYNGNDPKIAKMVTDTMNMNAELGEKAIANRRTPALRKTNIIELQDRLMGSAKQQPRRHTRVTPQKVSTLQISK